MGFNATEAVPKLDWDFTAYCGPSAKGTSPEPSSDALYEFNMRTRNLIDATIRTKKALALKEAERLNARSQEDRDADLDRWAAMSMDEAMAAVFDELAAIVPSEEARLVGKRQAELVAETLQNCPTADQILALPGRIQAAYFGWVAGQLMSPELGAAGTS